MCASARNMMCRSTDHVCKFKERYHPHPTPPHPNPTPSHDLRSTDHVCKFKERYHPHPTPPHPMTCVAPTMCASSRNVIIPTPPNPMTCVAPTMCASARNVIIPTPPHPNPMTCVAPTMCASARNMMLRSTDHVCKFKERYHPHPTPPQPHANFIYINPLGAGVPGEPPAPRVYIYIYPLLFVGSFEDDDFPALLFGGIWTNRSLEGSWNTSLRFVWKFKSWTTWGYQRLRRVISHVYTLRNTIESRNIAPQTYWLEDEIPFWNGLVLGDIRSFLGVNTFHVASDVNGQLLCWMYRFFLDGSVQDSNGICSTPNSMDLILVKPRLGGLIQGQIYIPVESKIPFFWKPMIFLGIPCFCLLRGEHWVIELLTLPKIWAPVVFHPNRNTWKVKKNFRIFAQRARTKEAKLQVKSLGFCK